MTKQDWLAERFEENRNHLRGVAYRMLGSVGDADDAVQEAWLRLSRVDPGEVRNLTAWLTTVVSRICLNVLRDRRARREEGFEERLPEPVLAAADSVDPEHAAVMGDAVGLALLVVLDTLSPAERLAFVLHDTFGVPFDDIGPIVGRSPTAARQLASRARRRVRGVAPVVDGDLRRQWAVVDAFLAASRAGDFDALLALLDPDVVVRADFGPAAAGGLRVTRGAEAVARQALTFTRMADYARPVLVNGTPGFVIIPPQGIFAVLGATISGDRIAELDILADPVRLARLVLPPAATARPAAPGS